MKIRINNVLFDTIKLMMKGGATEEQIIAFKPISKETMRRIRRTESYEEYCELQRVYSERSAANIAKRKQEETNQISMDANQISMEDLQEVTPAESVNTAVFSMVCDAIREQTKLLELLSKNVAFIVSELTGKDEIA